MRHMDLPAICLGKNWVLRTEDGARDEMHETAKTHARSAGMKQQMERTQNYDKKVDEYLRAVGTLNPTRHKNEGTCRGGEGTTPVTMACLEDR